MIRAVLFDLDGTLVDSLYDLRDAVNFVLQKHGHPNITKEETLMFIGNGNEELIRRSLPEDMRGDREYILKLRSEFFDYYQNHCADNSTLFVGIKEMLTQLKNEGISCAVVTNKSQLMTDVVVPHLFDENTFSAVIGQRDGVPTKPEHHMPFLAMSEMDVNPDECLFVGDSGNDMEAGKNSGNIPVGVLWGYRDKEELLSKGARFIVEKPEQILEIIKNINQC